MIHVYIIQHIAIYYTISSSFSRSSSLPILSDSGLSKGCALRSSWMAMQLVTFSHWFLWSCGCLKSRFFYCIMSGYGSYIEINGAVVFGKTTDWLYSAFTLYPLYPIIRDHTPMIVVTETDSYFFRGTHLLEPPHASHNWVDSIWSHHLCHNLCLNSINTLVMWDLMINISCRTLRIITESAAMAAHAIQAAFQRVA